MIGNTVTIKALPAIGECLVKHSTNFPSGRRYTVIDRGGHTWHKLRNELEIVKLPPTDLEAVPMSEDFAEDSFHLEY